MGGFSIFAVCIVDPDPMSSEEEQDRHQEERNSAPEEEQDPNPAETPGEELEEDIEEPFEDPVGEGVDENESNLTHLMCCSWLQWCYQSSPGWLLVRVVSKVMLVPSTVTTYDGDRFSPSFQMATFL